MTYLYVCFISYFLSCPGSLFAKKSDLNLHPTHLPYYFHNYPQTLGEYCDQLEFPLCKNKTILKACWGYELNCDYSNSFSKPLCPHHHAGWTLSKKEQLNTFYSQADFGYVRDQRNELMVMCEASSHEDSHLECSNHLRFCRGRNILMNFTSLASYKDPIRYKMDVLKDGEIGGYCNLFKSRLSNECDHLSPLQSWGPELQHFTSFRRTPIPHDCDVIVNEPTYVMKIDAVVNMYHHFCDFFNLYVSQHVNSSHEDVFSTNIRILIWETYSYQSAFGAAFDAFTEHPIWNLKTFSGKTVCFKNIVFPLLPRMIFGLYYNTPLISGCEKSGLFRAFSEHVLYRLKIPVYERDSGKIRVTFLSRDTMYRKVLNERQLLHSLNNEAIYNVNRVIFDRNVPFKEQLRIIRNTDLLISIHGAGLTHLLFLPDWAVVFELYNCEDAGCYYDLARLRGIKYVTWQDPLKLQAQDQSQESSTKGHAKFTNYKFDAEEFMKLVTTAKDYILKQESFRDANRQFREEL